MKRHKIIIGNWKMNLTVPESTLLLERLVKLVKVDNTEVVVCPSFLAIYSAQEIIRTADLTLGAQDAYFEDEGAFTGEVSAHQLKGFVTHAILGHSERRRLFSEGDRLISQKVAACVRHGIKPVVCVGESLHEKNDGLTKVVVSSQVEACFSGLTAEEVSGSVIAYEPIWSIGTGHVCDPRVANEVARNIRNLIKVLYGAKAAESVHIVYGGSVDEKNAETFLKKSDLDGFLIGGASLDYSKFSEIVETVERSFFDEAPKKSKAKKEVKRAPKKTVSKTKKAK